MGGGKRSKDDHIKRKKMLKTNKQKKVTFQSFNYAELNINFPQYGSEDGGSFKNLIIEPIKSNY